MKKITKKQIVEEYCEYMLNLDTKKLMEYLEKNNLREEELIDGYFIRDKVYDERIERVSQCIFEDVLKKYNMTLEDYEKLEDGV